MGLRHGATSLFQADPGPLPDPPRCRLDGPDMTQTRRRFLVQSAAACAIAQPVLQARANGSWLIGQSAPLSGVLAASNAETVAGAQLCFGRVNAAGGVHGKALQLAALDDAQDARRAADNTRQFIEQGAVALALYRTTPCISAALPLAQKASLPFIGSQVGPQLLYEPVHEVVYNTRSRYHDEVARVVQFFAPLGVQRFAALVASDAFGKDVVAGLMPALAAAKLELLAQASIDNRSADVAQQLQQIRQAAPQVVLLICNAKAAAEFVKAARASGFNPTFVSLSNTSSASYVKDLGAAAEGVVVTQVVPTPYSGRLRAVAEFRDAQAAGAGAAAGQASPPLSHAALQGWLTARFIVELLRRAGPGATREKLVDIGRNAPVQFDLGSFPLSYSATSRQGSRLAELTIIGKDGRFLY